MTSSRKRQRTLLEFASSSPTTKYFAKRRKSITRSSSNEDCNSDPGKIQFEHRANGEKDGHFPNHLQAADDKDILPRRYAMRMQKPQSSPIISVNSSSEEETPVTHKKRFTRFKQSHRDVVVSDESESQYPRKRRQLVKGRRPEDPTPGRENDDERLIDEVDEDMILNSRLRDRSKKSAYAQNLERLQRRRRGQAATSDSEDASDSESSESGRPAESKVFTGAYPSCTITDGGESLDGDNPEDIDNDFIVEDDGVEDVPELPTLFSMGTFQDLSHHFKIICQLFVHMAVKDSPERHSFMEKALKQEYFSVPLAITRRKLSGMRDSLVTSSIWKPEFKNPLEKFPTFQLEQLEFSIPICDACHLGNRVATLRGILSGPSYDKLTYERRRHDKTEEGSIAAEWNLGRFCAVRAQVFHTFTHWEHILYHTLRMEVDNLKEAISQLDVGKGNGRRVFIPATNGPAPPEDLDDADEMMDWLDGRGIINSQWAEIKHMMERAHNLEAKGRGAEDDIELG